MNPPEGSNASGDPAAKPRTKASGGTQPDKTDPGAQQPGDPELAVLVRNVDQGLAGGLTLTVLVGGASISGQLISGAQWWKGMGERARGPGGGNFGAQFSEGAEAVSQVYCEPQEMEKPIGYLHLQDVVTDGNRGTMWRIKMEAVEGWRWGH